MKEQMLLVTILPRLFSNCCSAMREVDLKDKTDGRKIKIMQMSAMVLLEAILRMIFQNAIHFQAEILA